jgi:hypothetical protein
MDRCRSYLVYQLNGGKELPARHHKTLPGPAITMSYQTGAGEHEVAGWLAGLLQAGEYVGTTPWTVFYRNLVERVLKEHNLPANLAKFVPEDRRCFIREAMDELVGLHPPSWVMVPEIAKTVLHLVDAGHVILVGRGASLITTHIPNVFHVRLIASLPTRIERVQKLANLTPEEAAKFVAMSDRQRGRYARAHFHASAENDLLYHMVVNTDRIPYPSAAQMIADAARVFFSTQAESSTATSPGLARKIQKAQS